MSKLLITKYHNQLHEILNAGGTRNETSITFAFASLLRAYAEKKNLLLVEQFEFVGKSDKRIRPDGVLKYFGGIDLGYWEAKDTKDNLNDEIHKKLNEAGYPSKNIIFENTQTAVLFQEGAEVMRVSMTDWNLIHSQKIRAELKARVSAPAVLHGFFSMARLGQRVDGFAHQLRNRRTV